MTDYIKREDAIKAFDPRQRREWYTPWIVETLKDLPTVDVAPVRRGHWDFYDGKWYCSVCGYCMEWCLSKPIEDWCGSCGARMDGDGDDD